MNTLKFTQQSFRNNFKSRFIIFRNKILNELKSNKGKIVSSFAISFFVLNINNFYSKNKKVIF